MPLRPVHVCRIAVAVAVWSGSAVASATAPEARGSTEPGSRRYDGPDATGDGPDAGDDGPGQPHTESNPDPDPEPDPDPGVENAEEAGFGSSAEPSAGVTTPARGLTTGLDAPERRWLPRHRLIYRNLVAGRINPPGFVNETTFAYRLQIVSRDTPAFRDSFLITGAHAFMTPAFVRVGPTIEFQPIAILNLGATYDFIGGFGTFGLLQSFDSPTAEHGPDTIDRNRDADRNYVTWGQMITLSALLQGKVERVAFRTSTKASWTDMRLRSGDTVFYDPALDIMMPNRGWAIINETDLVYLFDFGLAVLARHSLTHAFYRRGDFLQGEAVSQPNGPTSRLGPAFSFTIFDRPGVRFNRPTVFLLSQWWLRHRYRTGLERNAGLPYLAVGFSFEGDLVPHRKDPLRGRVGRRPRNAAGRP